MTVYFIGCGSDSVKIGYTSEKIATARLAQLQTSNPYTLYVLAQCHGSTGEEGLIHSLLSHSRIHGEWFHRTERVESLIEYVRAHRTFRGWIGFVELFNQAQESIAARSAGRELANERQVVTRPQVT